MNSHPWSVQAIPYDFVILKRLSLSTKQALLNSNWKVNSGLINFWYGIWFGEIPLIKFASGNPLPILNHQKPPYFLFQRYVAIGWHLESRFFFSVLPQNICQAISQTSLSLSNVEDVLI